MYNNHAENINIGSTAASTRSILDSQLQRQSEYMINKSNPSANSGLHNSSNIEDYSNTYKDARKQIQVLNNTPVSNAPPQF